MLSFDMPFVIPFDMIVEITNYIDVKTVRSLNKALCIRNEEKFKQYRKEYIHRFVIDYMKRNGIASKFIPQQYETILNLSDKRVDFCLRLISELKEQHIRNYNDYYTQSIVTYGFHFENDKIIL